MIFLEERETGFEAIFLRNDYMSVRGTGETKREALVNLRSQVETILRAEEMAIQRAAAAVDDIDKMLG